MSLGRYALSISAAAMLLAGCSGSQPPVSVPNATAAKPVIVTHTNRGALSQQGRPSCPCLYVTNSNGAVTVYASGATGNARPIQNIQGSRTGLSHPHDVAVDGGRKIYVVNNAPPSVTEYAAGATGNARPIERILGLKTRLRNPTGIAVDSSDGDIYVSNISGGRSRNGSVTIYAPGSNGDVSPLGVIEGGKTLLDHPNCLAVDSRGNIAVTNAYGFVVFFSAGSAGNIAPIRTIAGALTNIKLPTQVALDSNLNAYVANLRGNSLTVYASDADGNVPPIQDIHGSGTKLRLPLGVAVNADGAIYAASGIGPKSRITVYAAGSNGSAQPVKIIEGSNTSLVFPQGITVH